MPLNLLDLADPAKVRLMMQLVAQLGQIRLKSPAPTFSGTDFVCHKTRVTTVD
jgi:hypothetical protein